MKKVILYVALAFISLNVMSQVKFGVRAGVGYYMVSQSSTSARFSEQPVKITEPTKLELLYAKNDGIGYNFGLFLDLPITGNFFLQLEPSISFRNYSEVLKTFEVDTLISVQYENYIYNQLTYFDIPILFKYNLDPNTGKYGRKSFFSFFGGVQAGIYLNSKESNKLTSIVSLYEQRTVSTGGTSRPGDFKLEYNTIDVAVVAGAMYEFERGFRFGARYVGSVMPLNSNINFNLYHHSFQMTMGFNFIPQ